MVKDKSLNVERLIGSAKLSNGERDLQHFNEIRTTFINWLNFDPLSASKGIQPRICRENLLIEFETIAICATG